MPKHEMDRREFLETGIAVVGGAGLISAPERTAAKPLPSDPAAPPDTERGWWPQSYSIGRDGRGLRLSTRYYTVEHDLKRGGAISTIRYTHGAAHNLLARPIAASARLRLVKERGQVTPAQLQRELFTDVADSSPIVSTGKAGQWETISTQARLLNPDGQDSGITVRTSYTYRWGYIKVHREFHFPSAGVEIRNLSVLSTGLHPSLTHYGYRPNPIEVFPSSGFGAPHSFWGEVHPGAGFNAQFETRYIPCHAVWANPGIEGVEWFSSDDVAQWNYQVAGEPGTGRFVIQPGVDPSAVVVSIDALSLSPGYNLDRGGYVTATGSYAFDYYVGMPILEGHAQNPWFERSYGANGGAWVSEDQIRHSAELGVKTMTLHNDGDSHHDGLYWHDGSWPPYPPEQMKKMAEVIENCHKYGIKTVPYFSDEELNQVTPAFKEHGEEWGCKPDDQGNLRPNYNYGALMCLKSGWLKYLEFCVDRVLKHYPFDGVYYDWMQPLYCNNPLHMGKESNGVSGAKGLGAYAFSPTGHWAIDEYLELMEWTRQRVGPSGLVLIHDSNSPVMAIENFTNAVVTMEWGYGKLSTAMPPPRALPLEWTLVRARARAVTEYGNIDKSAAAALHQLFYLTTMITGIAPWPASDDALRLFKLLKPLGSLEQYHFQDWRNGAVHLNRAKCYSAVYSRPGEAYVILANMNSTPARVVCSVTTSALKNPMSAPSSASLIAPSGTTPLDAAALAGAGQPVDLPAAGAVLIHITSA